MRQGKARPSKQVAEVGKSKLAAAREPKSAGSSKGPSTSPPIDVVSVVPDGKVVDFLTGKHFRDTAEEYVRQNIEKALVRQYRYSSKQCAPEFRIKMGSQANRVDIVVFPAGKEHTQENATILVETKRAGQNPYSKKDGILQLQSYMAACVNSSYGLWTNGDQRFCFAKRTSKGGHVFEEITDIPGFGQSEEDAQRPKKKDLTPATGDNLLFAFRRCHNYIAGTEGVQKQEAFWELLKIIFCKIEDERSGTLQFYATPTERTDATAAQTAKARIQRLFSEKVVRKYPSFFPPADQTIGLKPNVVAYIVSELQRYSLLLSPVDVKGVAYEEIVGSNLRGDRGEFFTPRNACRMAVQMLNPQPNERLLDPACGTGGFLIAAMNHALSQIEQQERANWADPMAGTKEELDELYRKRNEYFREFAFGLDLNPALVRAAKMNMVMNNDGSGGLYQCDSLSNPHTWNPELTARLALGSVDVLFTNPPFGANITIDDDSVLAQYNLGAMWDEQEDGAWTKRLDPKGVPILQKSQPPEILFIERCLQFLVPGTGRMAMVIPNGILNNPALGYVRHWLLGYAQVLAIVDMDRDLFQPKNDTQTSMVLLRKLSAEESRVAQSGKMDYPIFMAIAQKIGHDKRGKTIFRRNVDGDDIVVARTEVVSDIDQKTGQERQRTVFVNDRMVDDDLPEVATAYARWLESVS